ncbi:uncharacterized protein BDR25DRAFT_377712 [Lindgomyces ingoldianus]|uniref:Uncharacterized protein n=1 Tax=Lindgomyces ingoldianus TaxID=673940 RepID=A0ACB6QGJ8_9PLEO|nr:uncharacterized protein BDR25DRAFT_377712 [Lindgomyces ingoldianus]KAF2466051.1 hypothetical protein BDR25DRAFT_377712 [Lindgomyces ingoldianus]
MALVDLPYVAEFFAVLYVWGPPTPGPVIAPPNPQEYLPRDIPLAVQDAITVTRSLGFRYLWVDRYCISTDARVRHEQINSMDVVYRLAYATTIAAGGQHPSYGLPACPTAHGNPSHECRSATKRSYHAYPIPE